MRVLYVQRGKQGMLLYKRAYHALRDAVAYRDQDGFFEASLQSAALVTTVGLHEAARAIASVPHDVLVVNWKQQGFACEADRADAVVSLLQKTSAKRAVFIGAANAAYLPPEMVCQACDFIFKREPYADKGRYTIKLPPIISTVISCPFVTLAKPTLIGFFGQIFNSHTQPCAGTPRYEVGFSGADAADHSLRRDVWQRVTESGFTTIGGLQPNPYTYAPIPEALRGPRFKGKSYQRALCAAKINLALDGIGQYTFRHQELLYLGLFMMSGPSIRELDLPLPLEEGKHYVAFDDLDDMVEKIRYYLAHDDERHAIATAGQKVFREHYDPTQHGQALVTAIQHSL